ncbi:hypothetical protein ACOMHN_038937 [Nucella lapillus]
MRKWTPFSIPFASSARRSCSNASSAKESDANAFKDTESDTGWTEIATGMELAERYFESSESPSAPATNFGVARSAKEEFPEHGKGLDDKFDKAPKSRHACHSEHQPACRDPPAAGSAGSSSPQIMGLLVPAPLKPPCPVHGLFRLVQHPKLTVPAKRNADGSISIDLTHEEPGPKRAHIEESLVLSDIDSDLEIIG